MSGDDLTAPLGETGDAGDGTTLSPGVVFGRYLIIDRVGSGGVGEVYAAYDPNLDRRVALKILRSSPVGSAARVTEQTGNSASDQEQRGLVREAKALAKFSHPCVVTVHDVGVFEGRTFIAMELVEGVDLSAWLERRPHPGWRATLRHLLDAGHGLAAAHAKKTVHCDFKPANVMVGDDGRVRVSDFGLARLLDPGPVEENAGLITGGHAAEVGGSVALRTRGGVVVGTPFYMSPEQHDGAPPTIKTDIYAYCLTLHEALYAERPFPLTTIAALATAKAEAAPTAPTSAGRIPRRIRLAVTRGLAPSADQRWPSMADLLAELERGMARPYRRAVPLAVLGLAVAAAGGLAFAGRDEACTGARGHLVGVWDDQRGAELRGVFRSSGLSFAAQSEPRVTAALDAYANEWAAAYTSSCEATERREQSPERMDRSMGCLDGRLAHLRALLDVLGRGDPAAIERSLAAAEGLPSVSACLEANVDPWVPTDAALAEQVAEQRTRLAQVDALEQAGVYAEALPLAKEVAAEAEVIGYAPLRAEAKRYLGLSAEHMGKLDEAEVLLEEALWIAHAAGHAEVQAKAAIDLTDIVGAKAVRPGDGLRWARYAAAQLETETAPPLLRAALANNRGRVLDVAQDYDGAQQAFDNALELLDAAGLSQSSRAAATLDNMGILLRRRGRYEDALAMHERAAAMSTATLGADHPAVTRSLGNVAAAMSEAGRQDEAYETHARVLEIRERAFGPVHPEVATTLNQLAVVHFRRGEYEEAGEIFGRVLAIRTELMPDHPSTLGAMTNVALVLQSQGRLDEASAVYADVLKRQGDDVAPRKRAATLNNLANLHSNQGKFDAAVEGYVEALELYEQDLGPDHPEVGLALTNLGNVYEWQGKYDEARAVHQRALAVREKALGPSHPDVAIALSGLAGTYLAAGDPAPALPLLERALEIAAGTGTTEGVRGMIEFDLGQALEATGGDRMRARDLVVTARDRFATLPGQGDHLALMDAWLAGE